MHFRGVSPTLQLGLWSICDKYGVCDNYFCNSAEECEKLYAARIFMVIAISLATLGFIVTVTYFVLRIARNEKHGDIIFSIIGFCLLCLLAELIGVPLGISFFLVERNLSIGVGATLALLALILNFFCLMILCVSVLRSHNTEVANDPDGEADQIL